jgi:hypothetical protein
MSDTKAQDPSGSAGGPESETTRTAPVRWRGKTRDGSRRYLALTGGLMAAALTTLCVANVAFAPEMYRPGGT